MEKIATDTFSFSKLRENGFTYVDKTEQMLALVNMSIGSQFFCARPRRFGKSLLISTLQALFEGKRELFKGLFIDTSDYDWKTYPVVRLDMGSCQAETVEGFRTKLKHQTSSMSSSSRYAEQAKRHLHRSKRRDMRRSSRPMSANSSRLAVPSIGESSTSVNG